MIDEEGLGYADIGEEIDWGKADEEGGAAEAEAPKAQKGGKGGDKKGALDGWTAGREAGAGCSLGVGRVGGTLEDASAAQLRPDCGKRRAAWRRPCAPPCSS